MTRAEQWSRFVHALLALAGVAMVTALALVPSLRIGAAAAGLLYMIPVLWVSTRAGLSAGLASAAFAAFCYNYFLLEPRYTLRIHGVSDVAAFIVLMIVATVTSRLASGLRLREIDAREQAEGSAREAEFVALLAREHRRERLDQAALAFLGETYGETQLIDRDDLIEKRTRLSPLDAAAASWALHNGVQSGHGTEVMPACDLHFVPLGTDGGDVLAVAEGIRQGTPDGERLMGLARLWAQARDRITAQAARQARDEADQREQVRRALLAALGHDFRTPLTVLKSGLAEMGGETPARLGREVERIIRLSDDLIAAARLETGQPARLEPVDLVDAVGAALPATLPANLALRIDIADDLPMVQADAVMLTHLLGNLIANGLRHARAELVIGARQVEDRVAVDIADDGEGIDPAVAGRLFDPFVSGAGHRDGLGLAIVRDLARAMGATVASVEGAGTGACFRVSLAPYSEKDPRA